MTLPDWLIPILQQFPIVALVGVAVYFMLKLFDARHREELQRTRSELDNVRALTAGEISRMRTDHLAEINRLTEHYTGEVRRLQARITRLENLLRPPRLKEPE